MGRFLAPSVAADLANCQFFPPDPEATLPQDSKYPNIQQKILEDTQISKYIQVPACSLGLQIFQIYLSTEAPNYMEKINLTHLYVNIAWKDLFIFTGKNRRTDSPDLLLFSVHALPSLKILLQISKYYSWHKIVGEKKLCKI